jgi:hypothetical protein
MTLIHYQIAVKEIFPFRNNQTQTNGFAETGLHD